jgi:hypothetical protein
MRRSAVETEWGAYGDTEGAIEVEYGAYEEISAILPCEVNRGNLKVIGEWLPPNPPFQPTAAREIVRFLTVLAVRLRRLNGNPFGGPQFEVGAIYYRSYRGS